MAKEYSWDDIAKGKLPGGLYTVRPSSDDPDNLVLKPINSPADLHATKRPKRDPDAPLLPPGFVPAGPPQGDLWKKEFKNTFSPQCRNKYLTISMIFKGLKLGLLNYDKLPQAAKDALHAALDDQKRRSTPEEWVRFKNGDTGYTPTGSPD